MYTELGIFLLWNTSVIKTNYLHDHCTHGKPTAPSAPPQSLSGTSQGSRSIALTWSPPPPIHINGVIEKYVVKVTERETEQTWTFFAFDGDILVGSLHPHYHYDCRVAAFTIAEGALSSIFTVQTEEERKMDIQYFNNILYLIVTPLILMFCSSLGFSFVTGCIWCNTWLPQSLLADSAFCRSKWCHTRLYHSSPWGWNWPRFHSILKYNTSDSGTSPPILYIYMPDCCGNSWKRTFQWIHYHSAPWSRSA